MGVVQRGSQVLDIHGAAVSCQVTLRAMSFGTIFAFGTAIRKVALRRFRLFFSWQLQMTIRFSNVGGERPVPEAIMTALHIMR